MLNHSVLFNYIRTITFTYDVKNFTCMSQVLTSLRILLLTKPAVIHAMSRQVSSGLHDLLRTNAANIHSTQDWCSLFILLEVVGAGCNPPPLRQVHPGVDVSETISDAGEMFRTSHARPVLAFRNSQYDHNIVNTLGHFHQSNGI